MFFFVSVLKPKYREVKNEITTILINKVMRKKQEKKDYERPVCLVYEMKSEAFFCVSVTPAPMTSHEEDWDPDEEKDFGEVWVE